MRRNLTCIVAALLVAVPVALAQPEKPAPTHRDVSYGSHERNVLDFWQATSAAPTPLVVFIHGGGFRGGSKDNLNAATLRQLLDAGISVAAIHYRFVQQKRLPAAHHDSRRALQFLRSKGKEWNIDKTKVGAFGGSAGAQLSMYLAFHDDMANPQSQDPVERESTRLAFVATTGGQTTMDLAWWKKWIPGYDTPHRDQSATFDAGDEAGVRQIVEEISALALVTADDPPIFMSYNMAPGDPVPADPQQATNWKVHHVIFGIKLKEKMDALGVEADLKYPGATSRYASVAEFFRVKFARKAAPSGN